MRVWQFGPVLAPLAGPRVLSPLLQLRHITIRHAQTLQLGRLASVEMRLAHLDLTGSNLTLDSPESGWLFLASGVLPIHLTSVEPLPRPAGKSCLF